MKTFTHAMPAARFRASLARMPGPTSLAPIIFPTSAKTITRRIYALFMKSFHVLVGLLCTSGFYPAGWSQTVPALINYQGRLADSNGVALPTSDYQLAFNIYDAATGGNLVWGPQVFDGTAGQGH